MNKLFYLLLLIPFIACDKDDDNDPINPYPITYSFDHIDQDDEGLYLVNANKSLTVLPTNIGLYGAHKDSLKTELQPEILSNLDLQEIELTSDTTIIFHYIYQGHPVLTPARYTLDNGQIIISDTLFSDLVQHDLEANEFVLCGVTPFALPGPNAFFPFGPPYWEFNTEECMPGFTNQDYAEQFADIKDLQPLDTVGVLLTKYIYSK